MYSCTISLFKDDMKGQKGVFKDDRRSLCWTSMCPFPLNFDDNYWLDCPSFASNPLDIQFIS